MIWVPTFIFFMKIWVRTLFSPGRHALVFGFNEPIY